MQLNHCRNSDKQQTQTYTHTMKPNPKTYSTCEIRVSRVRETPCNDNVDSPEATLAYWNANVTTAPWFDPDKEQIVVILLNARYRPVGHSLVSLGTINETMAHPREIFRPAVAAGAYALVVIHNHPSGDTTPSEADRRLTRTLAQAAEILGIRLLDHCILPTDTPPPGGAPYFSFRESGLL
jgi:DNA repair protein RadC